MTHKIELARSELSLIILALRISEVQQTLKATEAFVDCNLKSLEAHLSSSEACTKLCMKLEEEMAKEIRAGGGNQELMSSVAYSYSSWM